MEKSGSRACEFCLELHDNSRARFTGIYPDISSRVVARGDGLVAVPTIGQLFQGSLLILPEQHYETCADFPAELQVGMCRLLDELLVIARRFGEPVFFEHGARNYTGGSCGIYHAHLHLVPLPQRVRPALLFPDHQGFAVNLLSGLRDLLGCNHYLLMGDDEDVVYSRVDAMMAQPGSQYFRRLLVKRFGLPRPWDWREFNEREPDLVTTLDAFGGLNADSR